MITPEEMERQNQYIRQVADYPSRPKYYHIVTYGCQMNAHDSEKLSGMLEAMGMTAVEERRDADFVLFNTCCIRENAERRALGNITWLKELRKERPHLLIGVCGCMMQQEGMGDKILRQYPFVDLAFGTANTHRLPELLHRTLTEDHRVVEVDRQDRIAESLPIHRGRKESAYITIMYGCDNYCSYCIVPYVRGRERSRTIDSILAEADQLKASGVQEIMLLGQNVNSYGRGLRNSPTFAQLLKELDRIGIPRIRFMTSHPKDLSDELIQTMADSRHILPQFHLPVQSGSDRILHAMRRVYTREQYVNKVSMLREAVPGIGLTTDIIVGFPGETEVDFEDTISLVDQVGYDSAFTFIYSPRNGTKAASFSDQVPEEVSSRRLQRLIHLQEKRQAEMLQRFLGKEEHVLVESLSKRSDSFVSGKGRYGISITLPGTSEDIGRCIKVRVNEVKNNSLLADRCEIAEKE